LDVGSLKVGECGEVPRAEEVAPCGAEVQRFMVIYRVDEVKAMFPMVGGIRW
jgi:hypothetical protein